MAEPMSAGQIITQLKNWRIPFKEYKNWNTHNRNHKGPWGGVNGFMIHHTGSDGTDQRELLYNGFSDLPGPLCHFGLDQKGVIHLIGWGRANHAGGGDPNVFKKVVDENYTGILKPQYHDGSPGAVDGNRHFLGVEIWYSGSHEMTAAQMQTLLNLSAAICKFHGWSSKSVIAHGEWSDWKWDPGRSKGVMYRMDVLREEIKNRIKEGPMTTPADSVPGKDVPEAQPAAYTAVWKTDAMAKPQTEPASDNKYWEAETMLRYACEQAAQANENVKKLAKHLGLSL